MMVVVELLAIANTAKKFTLTISTTSPIFDDLNTHFFVINMAKISNHNDNEKEQHEPLLWFICQLSKD